jgi:hypothetical protein
MPLSSLLTDNGISWRYAKVVEEKHVERDWRGKFRRFNVEKAFSRNGLYRFVRAKREDQYRGKEG